MRLLAPSALALAALAAPLVLLYFLKLDRRRRVVSSLLLWREVKSDPRANRLWERLRRRLHLLAQVLLLLLMVLAAARPYLPLQGLPGKSVVLVADLSGTMKARDGRHGASRFEDARARLREIVAHLGRGEEALLLTASTGARVVVPFTSDRGALAAAIDRLAPHDAPGDLAGALTTALALARNRRDAGVVVLSDLAASRLHEAPAAGRVVFEVFGEGRDNLAVTVLSVRERAASSFDRQALVAVKNFSDLPRTTDLEVSLDGRLVLAESLEVPPGEQIGRVVDLPADLPPGTGGLLEARIGSDDLLPEDDVARAVATPKQELRVAVAGTADVWLERALTLDPSTRLVGEGADVTVYVHRQPPRPLPGSVLVIDPPPEPAGSPFLLAGEAVRFPAVTSFRREHPVMAFVDLSRLVIERGRRLTPPAGATVLAETTAGPLIVAGETAAGRYVALAVDPLDTDLPLRVGFPVLIQNALRWLHSDESAGAAITAGEAATVRLPAEARRATLLSPSGEQQELAVTGSRHVLTGLDDAGVWRLRFPGGEERQVAVNAGSEWTSDIRPGTAPRIAAAAADASPGATLTGRDATPFVLASLFVALLVEWGAHHRRWLG